MTLRPRAGLAAILLLFFLSAMLFVRRPGIEADEAVVTSPGIYAWSFGSIKIPVMEMSYVGALKSWFYLALSRFVKPGPVSLRTPTVLVGAAAVWLFFLLLDRTLGRRAAWIGALLLATDSMFVLLEALDFGPNALHFVFKLAAMLLLVRFHFEESQTRARWLLAAAFFIVGLALWDKAIFIWAVFGVSLAMLAVFPREVWRHVTVANLSIAAAATILGASPLIAYNTAYPLQTIKANAHAAREPLTNKIVILERTLNGAVLFGFFTAPDPPPHPGHATSLFENASQTFSEAAHHPTHNLTIEALCLACLGLFARASRKPVLFGLLASAGTWLAMLITAGTGGAAHHVILIWPFPFFAIAAALAQIPWRWAAAAATGVLCVSNLAVTNEYYWQTIRNGLSIRWTGALYPLRQQLEQLHAPNVYIVDWGIVESLDFLEQGTLPVSAPDWSDAAGVANIVSDPRAVFVGHTARYAYLPQERAMLEEEASSAGYEEVPVETIYDRYGRPTFDVFRFRKIPL